MSQTDRPWSRRGGTVQGGGLRLHYAAWGPQAAPPLLLLHGGAANTHWFDWLAPKLAKTFRVLALDFPGHGGSDWPRPPRYRMGDFVAAVIGFAKAMGLRRLDLVGHSLGGKVGMLVAAKHPRRVRSLVILDATPDVSADGLAEMRQIGTRPMRLFPSRTAAARAFRLIPRATLHEVPDTCHHLVFERPGEAGRAIRDFLVGHLPVRSPGARDVQQDAQ